MSEPVHERLIRLGIAIDYPVHWSFERILRDLNQNFYDSIGYEKFGESYHYSFREEEGSDGYHVLMKTEGHPFHYEWLIYVGGSTKTGSKDKFIGKYGEGFKICMLSLIKLGITDITMHSQNWVIKPCIYEEIIDRQSVRMLGYHLYAAEEDNLTVLSMRNVPARFQRELEEGLLHFFYPQNPLFGRLLFSSENCIVYESGRMPVPCQDPEPISGILFLNYLARGRLPFPLFIMANNIKDKSDSRKRTVMERFDVWEAIYALARKLAPEESLLLLIHLKEYWNDLPASKTDNSTWYYLICQLVRNISRKDELVVKFRNRFSDLAYIERKDSDKRHNAVIDRTAVWAKEHPHGSMVNPVFRLLGAKSLVAEYMSADAAESYYPLTPWQQQRMAIITDAYRMILPEALQTELPDFFLGTPAAAEANPLQYADSDLTDCVKKKGQKYVIRKIILQKDDFCKNAFDQTLTVFLDKMLHAFGSSRSAKLNVILTNLGMLLMMYDEEIDQLRQKWTAVADE